MSDSLVKTALEDSIYTITLARPAKRNAINDDLLAALEGALNNQPERARVIVLAAEGEHFCAGLDLSEHQHRDPYGVTQHSQWWHRVFRRMEHGGVPVVAALRGAVIGGGLELAAATHVRVAEIDTFYQLPEGRHGIFVGGGASVRVTKIIGPGRMCEMMLTGRIVSAEEGQGLGLSHYLVGRGESRDKAHELAQRIAQNAPLANWAMVTAIDHIHDMTSDQGLYVESLTAALTQTGPEVRKRIAEFLRRKGKGPQT